MNTFIQKRLPEAPKEYVMQYERKMLTGELARIFASFLNLGAHESRVVTTSQPAYEE